MIKTFVPPGCAIRLIDLPYSVDELVSLDEEGFANIYLNARHSYEKQKKSLRHAIKHLDNDDFYNNKDIQTVEREADELPPRIKHSRLMKARDLLPPEPPKPVIDKKLLHRDMATLQRIGLLDFDWRTDPLLNLPDYW